MSASVQNNYPTRVRKSLTALKGSGQRKSYFYCLKLLGILPVPPTSDFNKWTYYTPTNLKQTLNSQPYRPKCLHDVLIASHATGCEHGNFYFSFYHRHQSILIEIFLNFAHQIMTEGLEKLKSIYPPTNPRFAQIYNNENEQKWKDAIERYKTFQNVPEQVANHYWNPTDYESDADLTIPEQLQYKQVSTDPIDILFKGINNSYPWQFNIPRRWFNEGKFDANKVTSTRTDPPIMRNVNGRFSSINQQLTTGQTNIRVNPGIGQDVIRGFVKELRTSILKKNYDRFTQEHSNNFILNNIKPDHSKVVYGAKSKGMHFISNKDRDAINNQFGRQVISTDYQQNYNRNLPHYSFAEPFFNKNLLQYFTDSIGGEISHGQMHVWIGSILDHGSFSLTSLLFYPYHSWIDAQIQLKIRKSSTDLKTNGSIYDYLRQTSQINSNRLARANKQDINNELTSNSMAEWKLSGDDSIPKNTRGLYPIIEWVSPSSNEMQFAFCSRDYVLTKDKRVRTSLDLNDIYKSAQYVSKNKERYAFFDKINEFNYNYNYQLGHQEKDLNNILNSTASNLPNYLEELRKHFDNRVLTKRDQVARDFGRQTIISQEQTQSAMISRDFDQEEKEEEESLGIQKIFQGGVNMFVCYPPDISNGSYPINVKLKNVFVDLHKILSENDIQRLEAFVDVGLQVSSLFIFGKASEAFDCHNCLDNKGRFIELEDQFRLCIPTIWKQIRLLTLNECYFDSENSEAVIKSVYDKISLATCNAAFKDYRFISGAEELIINVQSSIKSFEKKFIRLDAESFSVRTDSLKTIPSKKYSTFKTCFDFFKLHDVDNNHQRNYFDQYVYKTLKGWISLGEKRIKFSFEIPNFQRLLRLTLDISEVGKQLRVRVFDTDYKIKKAFYDNFDTKQDKKE